MMRIYTKILVLLTALLFSYNAYSQVEIEGTTYTRLSLAFNAINAGTHTGDIEVLITDDFTESTTAILQGSGNGNADYNSILIYPTGSYTIQGNLSNGILQFQGADNVTIDGRANLSGSTRSLTFKNNATSGTILRIDSLITSNDPSNDNVIQYCNFEQGSQTSGYGITFGASNSYTGIGTHSNNTIAYNSFQKMYIGIRSYAASGSEAKGLKIHNNIFGSSNLSMTITYQPLYLYYLHESEVYENTFDYISRSSNLYIMYCYYSKDVKVYNNNINNTSAGSSLYGFYCYYAQNIQVFGNKFNNFKTSSGVVYPIYVYHSSQSSQQIYDNVVNDAGGTSTFYGIYLANGNESIVKNNTISNIQHNSTFYGIMASSCSYIELEDNKVIDVLVPTNSTTYGYYMSSCSYMSYKNNLLQNISSGSYVYGVYSSSCSYSKYHNNLVDNLSGTGTSATGAIGFYTLSSNYSEFVNNSVSNIRTTRYSSTSNTANPMGMLFSSGNYYKIYFNSVNITGEQIGYGSSGSRSSCFMFTSTAVNNLDIRNNNLYNDLVGNPGSQSYCVYFAGSGNLTGTTMDYNNYYTDGPYGMTGYYLGNRSTLSAWKSGTGRDANSNEIFTDFNSSSILAPYIGSQLLGKGTPISGYQTDIIGVTRSATNPTPGAYEEADDIIGPEITFDKLLTTSNSGNRTVIATITDKTGLNTTDSEPRLYYRTVSTENTVNDNTSSSAGWKYANGTQNGDQFTFVIDYSKLQEGASAGDEIEYFIIARDVSDKLNVSTTSGDFANYPTTTHLNADNFPVYNTDKYRLASAIVGNINVGNNQSFTNLTGSDGLFEHINKNIVAGEVNIYITSSLSETGDIALGNLVYENGSYHKINIRPNTDTERIISGDVASGAVIKIIGADNVN
ncbi:MAG: hypothetical protein WC313_10440, partial [Candidatus Kapaibacterium sp.]